jgi:ubiquinone/menaquinone biosynthesis C-methylase UbiE
MRGRGRLRTLVALEVTMFKEIGHFVRTAKEIVPLQKQYPRNQFSDLVMSRADEQGYAEVRRELVGDLTGRVLEIGCGTGTMFQYYGPDARVEAIEPEADFLELAIARAASSAGRIRAASGNGMELSFADQTFDAVVFGLVLCSVPSVEKVIAEAHRVLKPGGVLRALEHVRSEAAVPGFFMDLFNPIWMRMNKQGCRMNRNPLGEIEAAGFAIDDVMSFKRFDTIMPAFQMRRVKAKKPGNGAP